MKNSRDQGFDQHYNVQVAVEQTSYLIVGQGLSNHPTDHDEALPTLDSIPDELGSPAAAALDNGYWSPDNVEYIQQRGIEPYIATGREPHHRHWQSYSALATDPPPESASHRVKMAL